MGKGLDSGAEPPRFLEYALPRDQQGARSISYNYSYKLWNNPKVPKRLADFFLWFNSKSNLTAWKITS